MNHTYLLHFTGADLNLQVMRLKNEMEKKKIRRGYNHKRNVLKNCQHVNSQIITCHVFSCLNVINVI